MPLAGGEKGVAQVPAAARWRRVASRGPCRCSPASPSQSGGGQACRFGGGYGAAGATGGVKAGAPYFEYGAAAGYSQAANTSVVGNPNAFDGGAHGSGNWGGGNGGAGAGGSSPVSSTGGFANASGSGGGGWAGGGGGTGHYISCWAVAGVTALRQDGGAGGGGSSYFGGGGGATVTMSSSSRQALNPPGNGAGGQIIVTYTPA